MTSSPRITYLPRPDTNPEGELNTLAAVYRFVLDCHIKKEGGPAQSRPEDDAKEIKNGCAAKPNYTWR